MSTERTERDPSSVRAAREVLGRSVRVADDLVDILVAQGVEVVFGLPGGPIAPLLDALIDRREIRPVITRHESGAMFAAAGYAQATGKLGVAIVTSGPGVLNAMTGLASAYCDGLPVLLLVGEVARDAQGQGALQDGSSYGLNVVAMAQHITKLSAEVPSGNAAPAMLRRAIATALSGRRGPVMLTLPMNTTTASITAPELSLEVSTRFTIPHTTLELTARKLAESRRTVILAGSGVRGGDGPAKLRAFAERLQCAVMTTPKGKGVFPETHPLSLGVFGMGGHPSTTAFLEPGIDALIVVGTRLGDISTNGWSPLLKPKRAFIQVDIDAQQLGRAYPIDLGIVAPAELFFHSMLPFLPKSSPVDPLRLTRHCNAETLLTGGEGAISLPRALWEIQRVLPQDTIYTVDSGEHFFFAVHYLEVAAPDSFMVMTGLGSMGSSIGAAIGAQLAKPDRRVAAICGDGCFAMNGFELATAAAEKLPITVFVINDQRLGMVELGDTALYGRTPRYPTAPMNVRDVAAALGAESFVVRRPGEILDSLLLRNNKRGPIVVDVQIDRTITMPKQQRFKPFLLSTARTRQTN